MIIKYKGLEEIRIGLEKVITKDSVFVCVGTSKVAFDKFGPLMGQMLRERNIPYYGDCHYNVNARTMYERLEQIYEEDGCDNANIIAIDAAVTVNADEKNTVVMKEGIGVKPGAGMGRRFPMIGTNSILMFTLHKDELSETLKYYDKGLYTGRKKDPTNRQLMKEYIVAIADMIEEIYNKACEEVSI